MFKRFPKHPISAPIIAIICLLISCKQKDLFSNLKGCEKIESYPFLYSYKTDSLRTDLQAKATVALVDSQLDLYFMDDAFYENSDHTKDLLYGGNFGVYPLNKIEYANSTVIIFLVKELEDNSFPELDMLSIVIYDKAGKPIDIVNVNLLNPFGSKEVNFTSHTEFEVLWIDEEYSPDFESESQDIENGNVPILITTVYQIDTVGLKFDERKTWQIDLPIETEISYQETDSKDWTIEDSNQFYFASTSPNAMKATPLYEYLNITIIDDSVWGIGAGDFMAGSQPWVLSFKGKLTKEKNMKLSVTYNQEGEAPFTNTETWTLGLNYKCLYRNDWKKSTNHMGAAEYHRIESSEIPRMYADQLLKLKLQPF